MNSKIIPIAILCVVAFAPVASAANDWSQFRYDETHQGAVPSGLNSEFGAFTERWWNNVSVPGPVGSPAVRQNIAYIGDGEGNLYALDQESGGVIWEKDTGGAIKGAPAVGPDWVYALNEKGSLVAYDRKTGEKHDSYPISVGASDGSVLFDEFSDLIYAGTRDGNLKAYFANDGQLKWSFNSRASFHNGTSCTGGSIVGTPVLFEGQVIMASTAGCVISISKSSFGTVSGATSPIWVFKAEDSIRSSPAIDQANKRVIVGDQSGNVYSIKLSSTGKVTSPQWKFTEPQISGLSSEIFSTAAIAGDKVIVASRNGNVRALSLSAGSSVWSTNLNEQVTSSPAVANGHILVGSFDRNMYMLSVADGAQVDKRLASGEIESSPAISGTQGIWASKDGGLHSYGGDKPDRADLRVESFTAASLVQSQAATLSATIRNAGALDAAAVTVSFYAGATLIADQNLAALSVGQTQSLSASYTPSSTGKVDLRVFADSSRIVQESDESNNEKILSLTVSAQQTQDNNDGGGGGSGEEDPGVPGFGSFALAIAVVGALAASRARRRV